MYLSAKQVMQWNCWPRIWRIIRIWGSHPFGQIKKQQRWPLCFGSFVNSQSVSWYDSRCCLSPLRPYVTLVLVIGENTSSLAFTYLSNQILLGQFSQVPSLWDCYLMGTWRCVFINRCPHFWNCLVLALQFASPFILHVLMKLEKYFFFHLAQRKGALYNMQVGSAAHTTYLYAFYFYMYLKERVKLFIESRL